MAIYAKVKKMRQIHLRIFLHIYCKGKGADEESNINILKGRRVNRTKNFQEPEGLLDVSSSETKSRDEVMGITGRCGCQEK